MRDVRAPGPSEFIWDSSAFGFRARRQRGPTVFYAVTYRTAERRQRWHTIGTHGSPWTPETARAEAKRILGQVASGTDPAAARQAKREALSVIELCDQYLSDAEAGRLLTRSKTAKKASTIITDKGRIERHIKPLLGRMTVGSVTREDVEEFMHSVADGRTAARIKTAKKRGLANVRGGKGTATRTVGLLGAIFSYSVRRRMRTNNPVHGVIRFADGRRDKRLTKDNYKAPGSGLMKARDLKVWPPAVHATEFLAVSGWRSGEVIGLRWPQIDLARRTATLGDTKTGWSLRPLSRAACRILRRCSKAGEFVFPATRGTGTMTGFRASWLKIAGLGGVPSNVTPHILRHSFASLAGDLGYSELTIAALLGHKGHSTTSRHIHAADTVLLAAADRIGRHAAAMLRSKKDFRVSRSDQHAASSLG